MAALLKRARKVVSECGGNRQVMGLLSRLGKMVPSHGAALGAADAVIAGTGGGMIGALSSMDDPQNLLPNMAGGAALGASAMAWKPMIMALARKMKAARPDVPDEEIMKAAEEAIRRSERG